MFSRIRSAIIYGIEAVGITVEVDVSSGLPSLNVIGLVEGAAKESKDRVRSALSNVGISLPPSRITINLAPADIRKQSSGLDLAMAVALLLASGFGGVCDDFIFFSELALDGKLKYTRGVFPIGVYAGYEGLKLAVSMDNVKEAVLSGAETYGFSHLSEVIDFLKTRSRQPERIPEDHGKGIAYIAEDMSDIKGQNRVKRAVEIAASGFHNILLIGSPGTGKSMIARRIPGILPRMSEAEIIETTKIYSASGLLDRENPLIVSRVFRSPHHTSSDVSLVGGGPDASPGEITLAHNGVLFLDEFPEFRRNVIESLRQPMEDGYVVVSRARVKIKYPARFLLVAAMNPCPCGFYTSRKKKCTCSLSQIQRYISRVSGPILDRIDIYTNVAEVDYDELSDSASGESSEDIRERVERVFEIQSRRFKDEGISFNSQMTNRHIKLFCKVSEGSHRILETAVDKLGLSPRSFMKVLKLARTIADMDDSNDIQLIHVKEAISYRANVLPELR